MLASLAYAIAFNEVVGGLGLWAAKIALMAPARVPVHPLAVERCTKQEKSKPTSFSAVQPLVLAFAACREWCHINAIQKQYPLEEIRRETRRSGPGP